MVKEQNLKKRLIKNSIIMLVAVLVSTAIAYSVYAWSSSLQEEVKRTENALNAARRDVSSREIKNADARKYLELYQQITGESEQSKISDLSREKAQRWLKRIATQHRIVNLEGSFSPVAPIKSESFKKKTLEGITSQVKLEFAAMTDENIYRFVNAITTHFPGYVKVTKFTLVKKGDITDSTLAAVGRGDFPALAEGSMEFNWIGVRQVEQAEGEEAANTNANSAPGGQW